MNAVSFLKQDHSQVAALFKQFDESDSEDKILLAGQICQLLTIHALIEEELLYPVARGLLAGDDANLVDEATVEHASIKELVDQIASARPEDALFEAKVTVLGEYVNHHVKEEEEELFPKLQERQLDLEALGQSLATRKRELMTELGVSADDAAEQTVPAGEASANVPPPTSRSSTSTSRRGNEVPKP